MLSENKSILNVHTRSSRSVRSIHFILSSLENGYIYVYRYSCDINTFVYRFRTHYNENTKRNAKSLIRNPYKCIL